MCEPLDLILALGFTCIAFHQFEFDTTALKSPPSQSTQNNSS